ncbi:MAG: flavodoxin family protein [Thermoguttaceae bacterium]
MKVERRKFIKAAGAALAVGAGSRLSAEKSSLAAAEPKTKESKSEKRVIALCGSHRLGKTTAASLNLVLNSLKQQNPEFNTELIELANYQLSAYPVKGEPSPTDEFELISEKIASPSTVGIVFGTPVYFGCMSSLMKLTLEKFVAFRKNFDLKNKIIGAVAVGGNRNGGQEFCLQQLWTALSSQQVIFAQDAPPTSHWGATLWNQNDSIESDDFGRNTAVNLGIRIAELAKMV